MIESNKPRILVPVDFSEQSKEGIFQALHIASYLNAHVILLHIIREHTAPWMFLTDDERLKQVTSIKEALLTEAKKIKTENTPQVTSVVAYGKLCDTILKQASELNAELIVMGTSTADNIKKKIIGGNALRIVTEASVPVITVKSGCATKKFNRIILPIDLAKESREKVSDVVQWAQFFKSKVYVVALSSTRDDAIVGNLRGQLRQVELFMRNLQIDVETNFILYKSGSREETLINYIKEKNGDMVVITTHQQLEIVRFFIGSFAEDVIHGSPVPVMSIVPKGTFRVISNMPGTN